MCEGKTLITLAKGASDEVLPDVSSPRDPGSLWQRHHAGDLGPCRVLLQVLRQEAGQQPGHQRVHVLLLGPGAGLHLLL